MPSNIENLRTAKLDQLENKWLRNGYFSSDDIAWIESHYSETASSFIATDPLTARIQTLHYVAKLQAVQCGHYKTAFNFFIERSKNNSFALIVLIKQIANNYLSIDSSIQRIWEQHISSQVGKPLVSTDSSVVMKNYADTIFTYYQFTQGQKDKLAICLALAETAFKNGAYEVCRIFYTIYYKTSKKVLDLMQLRRYLEIAIAEGCAFAHFYLALTYPEQSKERKALFQLSIRLADSDALYNIAIGKVLSEIELTKKQKIDILDQLVFRGYRDAFFERGVIYLQDLTNKIDVDKGVQLLRAAFERGHDKAALTLADHYYQLAQQDNEYYKKMLPYMRLLLRNNINEILEDLTDKFSACEYIRCLFKECETQLRKGDVVAKFNLAKVYLGVCEFGAIKGENFFKRLPRFSRSKEDNNKAYRLLSSFSDQYVLAQYALGLIHLHGFGKPKDVMLAKKLFEIGAIQNGNPCFLHAIAQFHFKGVGGPVDYAKTIKMYQVVCEFCPDEDFLKDELVLVESACKVDIDKIKGLLLVDLNSLANCEARTTQFHMLCLKLCQFVLSEDLKQRIQVRLRDLLVLGVDRFLETKRDSVNKENLFSIQEKYGANHLKSFVWLPWELMLLEFYREFFYKITDSDYFVTVNIRDDNDSIQQIVSLPQFMVNFLDELQIQSKSPLMPDVSEAISQMIIKIQYHESHIRRSKIVHQGASVARYLGLFLKLRRQFYADFGLTATTVDLEPKINSTTLFLRLDRVCSELFIQIEQYLSENRLWQIDNFVYDLVQNLYRVQDSIDRFKVLVHFLKKQEKIRSKSPLFSVLQRSYRHFLMVFASDVSAFLQLYERYDTALMIVEGRLSLLNLTVQVPNQLSREVLSDIMQLVVDPTAKLIAMHWDDDHDSEWSQYCNQRWLISILFHKKELSNLFSQKNNLIRLFFFLQKVLQQAFFNISYSDMSSIDKRMAVFFDLLWQVFRVIYVWRGSDKIEMMPIYGWISQQFNDEYGKHILFNLYALSVSTYCSPLLMETLQLLMTFHRSFISHNVRFDYVGRFIAWFKEVAKHKELYRLFSVDYFNLKVNHSDVRDSCAMVDVTNNINKIPSYYNQWMRILCLNPDLIFKIAGDDKALKYLTSSIAYPPYHRGSSDWLNVWLVVLMTSKILCELIAKSAAYCEWLDAHKSDGSGKDIKHFTLAYLRYYQANYQSRSVSLVEFIRSHPIEVRLVKDSLQCVISAAWQLRKKSLLLAALTRYYENPLSLKNLSLITVALDTDCDSMPELSSNANDQEEFHHVRLGAGLFFKRALALDEEISERTLSTEQPGASYGS